MGAGVRGRSPLLGEGRRGSVRLGRLGIGMISKSAKKDGTSIVHQCQQMFFLRGTCHVYLSEVSGMVFVEVDSVMVLTTGVTATSGMLSVFADAAVTV